AHHRPAAGYGPQAEAAASRSLSAGQVSWRCAAPDVAPAASMASKPAPDRSCADMPRTHIRRTALICATARSPWAYTPIVSGKFAMTRWLANLSVSRKLMLGFGLVLTLTTLITLTSW